jgi:cobalt/nickel transport system permease protein
MADGIVSNVVAGTMMVATTGGIIYSIKKTREDLDEKKVPLMGIMGAFIFAAQMINFSIPGTSSSGHIGGGILLAAILGPYAGFLTMASVLIIQAFVFADGGLMAYGCNVFNLGFYTCFLAYPLIFKFLLRKGITTKRIFVSSIVSVIIALQLGSLSVAIEVYLSGISDLPFTTFVSWMQPIHLAIGIIEGLITATVLSYVLKTRPEILSDFSKDRINIGISLKKILVIFIIVTILVGGFVSWFASSNPDGLEWSMFKTSGKEEVENDSSLHKTMADVQEKVSLLPDYAFKESEENEGESNEELGTSVSGVLGGLITFLLAILIGGIIKLFKRKRNVKEIKE